MNLSSLKQPINGTAASPASDSVPDGRGLDEGGLGLRFGLRGGAGAGRRGPGLLGLLGGWSRQALRVVDHGARVGSGGLDLAVVDEGDEAGDILVGHLLSLPLSSRGSPGHDFTENGPSRSLQPGLFSRSFEVGFAVFTATAGAGGSFAASAGIRAVGDEVAELPTPVAGHGRGVKTRKFIAKKSLQ